MPNLVISSQLSVHSLKKYFAASVNCKPLTVYLKGFTLIEVLVAISIIGILAGVSTVALNSARDKGRDSHRKQDLAAIGGALNLYFEQNGEYPHNSAKPVLYSSDDDPWIPGLVPDYIQKLPLDPKQLSLNIFENLIGNVYADTSGPRSPSSANSTNVSCPLFNVNWSSANSIFSSDNSRASVSLTDGQESYCLEATNFGFSIPSNAIVDGIMVEVELSSSASSSTKDSTLKPKILKNGSTGTQTSRSNSSYWPTSDTYRSYGGSAEKWDQTWTPADINASNFGVSLQASAESGKTATARIDHVRITVYYSLPAPLPTPTPTPSPTPTPTPMPTPTPTSAPSSPPPPPPPSEEAGNYMYAAVLDAGGKASSYVLWAQLENTRDAQAYPNPSRDCTDTPPNGSMYNYCQKPE